MGSRRMTAAGFVARIVALHFAWAGLFVAGIYVADWVRASLHPNGLHLLAWQCGTVLAHATLLIGGIGYLVLTYQRERARPRHAF